MAYLQPQQCGRSVLTAAIAFVVVLVCVQCDRAPPAAPASARLETPAPVPAVALSPVPITVLSRGDLVSAAGQAASAFAQAKGAAADPLVGRRFAVRIPFGCTGPSAAVPGGAVEGEAGDGVARWAWGPKRETIEISLTPGDWAQSPLVVEQPGPDAASPTWEAVEGFWIPRPWLAAETCPSVRAQPLQPAQATASPQTLGIAAVFEAGGSRIGRRNGKAYAFTVRAQGDGPLAPPIMGYRLLLEGRLVGFPDGRGIRCHAAGPDQRPVCVAAAQLDKVAFEDPAGATLSEWRAG